MELGHQSTKRVLGRKLRIIKTITAYNCRKREIYCCGSMTRTKTSDIFWYLVTPTVTESFILRPAFRGQHIKLCTPSPAWQVPHIKLCILSPVCRGQHIELCIPSLACRAQHIELCIPSPACRIQVAHFELRLPSPACRAQHIGLCNASLAC